MGRCVRCAATFSSHRPVEFVGATGAVARCERFVGSVSVWDVVWLWLRSRRR